MLGLGNALVSTSSNNVLITQHLYLNFNFLHMVLNEKMLSFNMFGSGMVFRVLCKCDGTQIVTFDNAWKIFLTHPHM
jgi:hypothetical protein